MTQRRTGLTTTTVAALFGWDAAPDHTPDSASPPVVDPTPPGEPPRFPSKETCLDLLRRAAGFATDGGVTSLLVASEWAGDLRWTRNHPHVATDRRDHAIKVIRGYDHDAAVWINQLDDAALQAAVQRAEALSAFQFTVTPERPVLPVPGTTYPETHVWSDVTYNQPPATRAAIGRALIAPAAQAGVLSSGYLSVGAIGTAVLDTREGGRTLYAPQTRAECSITVRDPQTGGSGWAGASSYDWTTFDPEALAKRALEKCLASRNPVRLEPGRYVTILEPQATYDLITHLFDPIDRVSAEWEGSGSPYYYGRKRLPRGDAGQGAGAMSGMYVTAKLGLRLLDPRITISHDPTDPALGVLPFATKAGYTGEPHRPVTWFDKGVLTALEYNRQYAVTQLHEPLGVPYSGAFRMTGGETTLEAMIAGTPRGLLVTRFSTLQLVNGPSLQFTGLTRDGLWLIENGKISKPVKNFRFTDSPLLAFNNVDELGPPVPVFSPGRSAIVPPVKLREFNFTSLLDAV